MTDFFFDPTAVRGLIRFCALHEKTEYFFVGDHGVYLVAFHSTDSKQNCVVYAKGCDPKVSADEWYDLKRSACCDDWGEEMPVAELTKLVTERATKIRIRMTSKHITLGVSSTPVQAPSQSGWQVLSHTPGNGCYLPLWGHPPKDETMAREWIAWAKARFAAGKATFDELLLLGPNNLQEKIKLA